MYETSSILLSQSSNRQWITEGILTKVAYNMISVKAVNQDSKPQDDSQPRQAALPNVYSSIIHTSAAIKNTNNIENVELKTSYSPVSAFNSKTRSPIFI